jgi:hypothetical protein
MRSITFSQYCKYILFIPLKYVLYDSTEDMSVAVYNHKHRIDQDNRDHTVKFLDFW